MRPDAGEEVEVVWCLAFFLSQHSEMDVGKRAEEGNSLNALQGKAHRGKVFKLKDIVGTLTNEEGKLDVNL